MDRRSLLKGALAVPAAGLLTAAPAHAAAPPAFDVLIGDVNSGKIFLFDRNKPFTDRNIKWQLNPVGSGHPMEHRFRDTNGDGQILLAVTGTPDSGTASIYRRRDKKLLWSANVPNYPHAIERARGTGVVVVAGRSKGPGGGAAKGGSLHVFRPTGRHSGSLVRAGSPIPFHQAHGLLWDPQLERMWAAGGSVLTAYRIVTTAGSARLVEDTARRLTDFHRAHDLQPDHQRPGRLLVTDTNGVYAVDKSTMRRTTLHTRRLVKSYVRHVSGEQMWTGAVPDGNAFGTKYVHFNVSGVSRARQGAVIYKARIATTAYL
ncbi:hypothetical protein ACWDUC_02055 [Streptomyces tricolor]|uniref:Uncharacterized protein n=1 Tax=Streptomyces tricolor TaxID=68277 RepID=A0ABS9JRV0_9ACTN|nr:hypothetical protein [Streptomyces tricolor]MCG0068268.1 hypothetical protein [Streptomyces tricolor]